MEALYARIRTRARQIVSSFPTPDFYREKADAITRSDQLMADDPHISNLQKVVAQHLEDDFGHGLQHADKVSLEAGALVLIETEQQGWSQSLTRRLVLMVQSAGLLHDIRRKKKNHAIKAAQFAPQLLTTLPFNDQEVAQICLAIQNHEAFKETVDTDSPQAKLISDCLYDADKFRWGPDNFTDTLWEMVSYLNPPLEQFLAHYPKGMQGLEKIKPTFRTHTGKHYGPNFIDIGIAIGEALYEVIQTEFVEPNRE
jgi:hypothetical protein